jgi:hypothetical protein
MLQMTIGDKRLERMQQEGGEPGSGARQSRDFGGCEIASREAAAASARLLHAVRLLKPPVVESRAVAETAQSLKAVRLLKPLSC